MIAYTIKFRSAAVLAAALLAAVAAARTVHTRAAAGAQPAQASAMGAAPAALTRPALHGFIACGTLSYSDCERLETILPE